MNRNIIYLVTNGLCLFLLGLALPVSAIEKEYIRDYDYIATDYDSKFTSRVNAIDGLKSTLLNELGTYVASVVEVNKDAMGNAYMTQDTLQLTAGIISLKLLQEKWNRISYYVQGKMRADEEDVLKALKALREDKQLEDALRDSMAELNTAREEIKRLKQQMAMVQSSTSMNKSTSVGQPKYKSETQQQSAKSDSSAHHMPQNTDQIKLANLEKQYIETIKDIEVEHVFQQALQARIDGDFKKSVKLFLKLAERDYPKAQSRLGHMYEKGMGVTMDYDQAMHWYNKAVALGYPGSLAQIGFLYERGLGVAVDTDKAIELYKQGIVKGSNYAKTRLGQLYVQGGAIERDYQKALQLFQDAAISGNAKAYAWLGFMHEVGYAVDMDYSKACDYYEKSAEQGNPWAMARLGNLYLQGRGIFKNKDKAYSLILAGSERGNSYAIGKLGHFYERGIVVVKDTQKAFELYQESARLGSVFGIFKLGYAYHKGIGVDRDKQQAIQWYEKAAARGHLKAQSILDKMKR